jgi:hypothetical protein
VNLPEVLAELDRVIGEAPPEKRPGLVVALSARVAALAVRMAMLTQGSPSAAEGPVRDPAGGVGGWITPERAAEIAGEPIDAPEARRRARRRIYGWAKGQRWANRPSRRCLRINEQGFRRWLSARS